MNHWNALRDRIWLKENDGNMSMLLSTKFHWCLWFLELLNSQYQNYQAAEEVGQVLGPLGGCQLSACVFQFQFNFYYWMCFSG